MRKSIFARTFVIVLIVSSIFFMCVFGAYYITSVAALKEQALSNAAHNLDMIRGYLDMTFSSINNSMYLFMKDEVLYSTDQAKIKTYFQKYKDLYGSITLKFLIEGNKVLAIDNPILLNSLRVDTAFYHGLSQKNRMVLTSPYYSPLVAGRTVAMIRSMTDTASGRELLLVAEMRTNNLFELLMQKMDIGETLIVLTPSGETVYMDYTSRIQGELVDSGKLLDINNEMRTDLMKLNSGAHELTIGKQDLMVQRLRYNQQWNLFFLVDSQQFHQKVNAAIKSYLFIAVMAVFVLAGVSMVISAGVTRPVKRLSKQVDSFSAYDLSLALPVQSQDEIGRLATSFNRLLERLQAAGREKAEFQQRHFRLEYKVLQSQIQPHFLFNIHMCIDSLLERGDVLQARKMLSALDSLLRSSIDKTTELNTLEDEITIVQNYILLQKMRHGNSFDTVIGDFQQYTQVKAPKLLLQPIVENAIYHGFSGISRRGEIRISFAQIDRQLHIIIEDNGCGIPPEKLDAIRNPGTAQAADSMVSIGLDNVRQRIRNYYGENCGLYISSRENIGTHVEMVIDLDGKAD